MAADLESAEFISPPDDKALQETARAIAVASEGSIAAIILYGSHVQGSAPNKWSAYDLFIVTDSYRVFYRALVKRGLQQRAAWFQVAFSQFLPPNVISLDLGLVDSPISKCAVFNVRHFRRALGRQARDHFFNGRVSQELALLWTRSPQDKEMVTAGIREAREYTAEWVRPFLPGVFDLERFAKTMLQVSYRAEIRPEHSSRVNQVYLAQRNNLLAIAGKSMAAALERGAVEEGEGSFRWKIQPGFGSRIRFSSHFAISKVRATARWFKYIFTFDGWIDYIQRKMERRAGLEIHVNERERRWPLIFLWPKFFRVMKVLRKKRPEVEAGNDSLTGTERDGQAE